MFYVGFNQLNWINKNLTQIVLIKKFLISLLLLSFGTVGFAQQGKFFLTHHKAPGTASGNIYFDLAQVNSGLVYVASKSGLLEFDGLNWELIKTPGAVYTIETDGEELFIGGRKGFGKLQRNAFNTLEYQSWSDSLPHALDINAALIKGQYIYFLNRNHLFIVNHIDGTLAKQINVSSESEGFNSIFEISGSVYVQSESRGLWRFDNNKLTQHDLPIANDANLIFADNYKGSDQYLLYTDNDELILLNRGTTKKVELMDRDYLSASVVIAGIWLDEHLLALGTIRGGVVFLDPLSGETIEIMNYQGGLPDNEVLTLQPDLQGSLWVAHQYGFTRIIPNLPFRSFSHYRGLQGRLLSAQTFNDKLYVGTSLGLFRLEKQEQYEEVVYYVKRNVLGPTAIQEKEIEQEAVQEAREMRKRGFLGFLKGDKKTDKQEDPSPKAQSDSKQEVKTVTQKRIRRELRAVDYAFVTHESVSTKITQLIPAGNFLFATGLGGVYLLNAKSEVERLSDSPIRFAYYHEKEKVFFAATYQNDILSFEFRNGRWYPSNIFDGFKDYVIHIFTDSKDRIWFCGLDKIYWILLKNLSVLDMHVIEYDNPYFEQTFGVESQGKVYFVNNSGIFYFDEVSNSFKAEYRQLSPERCHADLKGLWVYDERTWYNVTAKSEGLVSLDFLNLFTEISNIGRDAKNSAYIWVITADNELYRYDPYQVLKPVRAFPLLLKQVRYQDEPTSLQAKYRMEQNESGLAISFVQPDFNGLMAVEYRYLLKGSGAEWSQWSKVNNMISFNLLPVGEYELLIESRNAFGDIASSAPILLNIEPPYWRQAWFYAIEVSIFLFLVFVSIRLNAYSQKYRIVSRVLTFLTIIIFIEFIQTMAEAQFATETSPVIDFLIQVFIAFLIFPFEGYLRQLMLRQDKRRFSLSLAFKRSKSKPKVEA